MHHCSTRLNQSDFSTDSTHYTTQHNTHLLLYYQPTHCHHTVHWCIMHNTLHTRDPCHDNPGSFLSLSPSLSQAHTHTQKQTRTISSVINQVKCKLTGLFRWRLDTFYWRYWRHLNVNEIIIFMLHIYIVFTNLSAHFICYPNWLNIICHLDNFREIFSKCVQYRWITNDYIHITLMWLYITCTSIGLNYDLKVIYSLITFSTHFAVNWQSQHSWVVKWFASEGMIKDVLVKLSSWLMS